ncbi:hypothetical protein KIW84_024849, partial [Lathyrus oleraceus]
TLMVIETQLQKNKKSLKDKPMPYLVAQEQIYLNLHASLIDEQRNIFEEIMEAAEKQKGGVFFYMAMVEQVKHLCRTLCQMQFVLKKNCVDCCLKWDCKFFVTRWKNN